MKFGVLFICFVLLGCAGDEPPSEQTYDYVVFGHFYGFCVGEQCIEIFKVENGKLYEDSLDVYPNYESPYEGAYIELSSDLYDLVSDIHSEVPNQLFDITKTTIGCPDCTDGGGIFIQIKEGNEIRYWLIDQFLGNVPQELHDFVIFINEKISLLQ